MEQAGRCLKPGGLLFMYGPYRIGGRFTTDSNAAFHASLLERNPEWGLRDLDEVQKVASEHGLELESRWDMPANNFAVVYRKRA